MNPAEKELTRKAQQQIDGRQAFEDAGAALRIGAYATADGTLLAALVNNPNDPNLLRLLGISLTKQKRFVEAEERLTHVVRLVPQHAPAYDDLADAQMSQGKLEEALRSLRSCIKQDPDAERPRQRLAELLSMMGRGGEAEAVFADSLAANPTRRALAEAMEHVQREEYNKAEKIYDEVLRGEPENFDALRLLGLLCVKRERYDDAAAFFRRAVELAPDFWKAWVNLGSALGEQQKFEQAEAAFLSALALGPKSLHTLERLGANALKAGDLDKAIDWLQQSLALDDQYVPSLLCLGHALKTIGKQEEAIDAYRRCAAAKPDFGEVYWSLANLKTFRFSNDEVQTMQALLAPLADTPDDQNSEVAFSFALGKAFEDRKDYPQAFNFYSRGNSKKRANVNYDPIEYETQNDRIIDVFTAEFFAEREGWGAQDESPILILGLPRSGSTLLEQILASHSEVEGTAELHYLLRGATQAGLNRADGIKYPQAMHQLKAHHVRGIGEEYVENTLRHRSGARFFTDKMPNNFTGIGFLHSILPNAKVIDARRHPLDSCLGTFKQLFANGQVFSYDLYDLAHYYTQYVRMMKHWDAVLPGKVLRVNYEDVVADLDTQARAIAAHCNLDWQDSMLNFHQNQRAVKTASSEQVRQPIYSSSVSLWRHYEEQLEELIDYLEPVLLELPEQDRPKSLLIR
ncbi:MAG: tetratricopeptide (TPR) repeat protein [Bacteroidia bacterium]